MKLVLFDLDNTLIAGDSDYLWGSFVAQYHDKKQQQTFLRLNEQYFSDYQNGTLDDERYLQHVALGISTLSSQCLQQVLNTFIEERIKPIFLPRAKNLLETYALAGEQLVLVSATAEFIIKPIALLYGIKNIIGAGLPNIEKNIKASPCRGKYKVLRLRSWLNQFCPKQKIENAIFYSDSISDLPLLELVKEPIVVDGDVCLKELAEQRGWQQVSLR